MTRDEITRREALRRAAYVLGGTLSATTIAGVLAGCDRGAPAAGGGATTTAAKPWAPRTLTADQNEMVTVIAEHIIPRTDTPGARDARVNEFIDAMLTDYYPAEERTRVLAGLERVDARAQSAYKKRFLDITPEQQVAVLTAFDQAAYEKKGQEEKEPTPAVAAEKNPVTQTGGGEVTTGRGFPGGAVIASGAVSVDGKVDPEDVGQKSFFRNMKELTLVGYYTSEPGATQELHVMPMGVWRADIPLAQVGRAWA